jgi:hypothetical protein
MVDWNSRHPDIDARLQRIAFRIEPQDRRMLRDSIFEQDHINAVMKVLFLLTRWFLPFQFAGNKSADTFEAPSSLRKSRITMGTDLVVVVKHDGYHTLLGILRDRLGILRLHPGTWPLPGTIVRRNKLILGESLCAARSSSRVETACSLSMDAPGAIPVVSCCAENALPARHGTAML